MRGRGINRREMRGYSDLSKSDVPTLELLLESDSRPNAEACSSAIDTHQQHTLATSAPSSGEQHRSRVLRIAAVAIVASLFGAAVMHRYDDSSRPGTPHWMQACQGAIEATARLQRLHGIELDEAMQFTWAAVAGVHVQPPPIDTSSSTQLQSDADAKTRDCVTPTDPVQGG